MPRRRPSVLRDDIPSRANDRHRYSTINGLSGGCTAQIVRLERTRSYPGETARAFRAWWELAHHSRRWFIPAEYWRTADDHCVPECCGTIFFPRDHLDEVLRALPKRSARELSALVRQLDVKILARSPILLAEPSDAHWWRAES
ncbi:hypothetical protein [Streptomyces sp. NBC_00690]|uniref:hypothetical protein n=1 Tax=Streptomyces sp. NBC_00690 TaxID=2975808 RepID=UPI002E2C7398|nr:hypothetical protein [Streptomyces sp. NBC_00690]